MEQELIGLRDELNEMRAELGGIAHLRAEIMEPTIALPRNQTPPPIRVGDASRPSTQHQVVEEDIHPHPSHEIR